MRANTRRQERGLGCVSGLLDIYFVPFYHCHTHHTPALPVYTMRYSPVLSPAHTKCKASRNGGVQWGEPNSGELREGASASFGRLTLVNAATSQELLLYPLRGT